MSEVFEEQKPIPESDIVHSSYLELAGWTGLISLNYDIAMEKGYLARIGVSPGFVTKSATDPGSSVTLYMGLARLIGNQNNKLELGGGIVFGGENEAPELKYSRTPALSANLGYRYFPSDKKGISLRFAFTPVFNQNGFYPRFGASIGISILPFNND